PDPRPGLRLAASLRVYWRARGHAAEGAAALRALLDAPAAQGATLPRARALAAAARLLQQTGDYAIAGDYCQEALAIARAAGDDYLVAALLRIHAVILLRQGQPGAALPALESGLGLAHHLGEPYLTARLLSARAFAADLEGDHAGAARDAAESARLFRQAGDRLGVGQMLGNLGYYELSAGDLDAARRHLAESNDIARPLNDRYSIVHTTFHLGLAEYLGGSPGAAEALFAESLDLARRTGMRAMMAYGLIGLALAGRGGADPGRSARLHGAADQALADLGHALQPLEARLADRDRQRLRAEMGDAAFEADYAAGRTLDLAQVLAALGRKDAAAGQPRVTHQALPRMQAERAGAPESRPDAVVSGAAVTVLTPRELDVLKLVAQGLSNPEIARRLVLSEHTVHRHLANMLRKLNVSSRAEAAAWGVRTGLV
ncbi:MAG: tetratricopeptide repeat protein, partial [Actinobacteria bacterium]|nr:tetratricopeptide repeat protein [Actinomycetota bacterium]